MSARVAVLAACLALAWCQTMPANTITYDTRACQAPYNTFPFCNTALSIDARVADLISRLLPEEIPPLLTARHSGTPTSPNDNITRLGIPEWDWGMNAIHGGDISAPPPPPPLPCPLLPRVAPWRVVLLFVYPRLCPRA